MLYKSLNQSLKNFPNRAGFAILPFPCIFSNTLPKPIFIYVKICYIHTISHIGFREFFYAGGQEKKNGNFNQRVCVCTAPQT